ncbi:hypothetical protein LMG18101_00794 [Ralstonia flaminis]|jgi:hypothetical protein|uniref:Uncharacterized protein n=1 Tax=Ralstonia flaminis TaxID=3058597 RepID=A0ABM9K0C4_9RALS|nr:hypothetical protein LMG18101_00794 [Ralstonia sp. LMG 18101]
MQNKQKRSTTKTISGPFAPPDLAASTNESPATMPGFFHTGYRVPLINAYKSSCGS